MYSAAGPYRRKIAKQEAAKVKAINTETDDATRDWLFQDFMGLGPDVDFYWVTPFVAEYMRSLLLGHSIVHIHTDTLFLFIIL